MKCKPRYSDATVSYTPAAWARRAKAHECHNDDNLSDVDETQLIQPTDIIGYRVNKEENTVRFKIKLSPSAEPAWASELAVQEANQSLTLSY